MSAIKYVPPQHTARGWSCLNSSGPTRSMIAIVAPRRLDAPPTRREIPTRGPNTSTLNAAGWPWHAVSRSKANAGQGSSSLDCGAGVRDQGAEPTRQACRQPGAHAASHARDEPGQARRRARHHLPTGARYEKGTNRIGAGRLQQISHVLQVPVGFFFEGASEGSLPEKSEEGTRSLAVLDDFISSPEGLRLVQAFLRVESAEMRRRIVALVQSIASHDRYLDG